LHLPPNWPGNFSAPVYKKKEKHFFIYFHCVTYLSMEQGKGCGGEYWTLRRLPKSLDNQGLWPGPGNHPHRRQPLAGASPRCPFQPSHQLVDAGRAPPYALHHECSILLISLHLLNSRPPEWAKEQEITRAYGTYEELLKDPEVDAVYP
jgi:hypothetical protein